MRNSPENLSPRARRMSPNLALHLPPGPFPGSTLGPAQEFMMSGCSGSCEKSLLNLWGSGEQDPTCLHLHSREPGGELDRFRTPLDPTEGSALPTQSRCSESQATLGTCLKVLLLIRVLYERT